MSGIINVNSSYNVDSKRVISNLSFEMGETFLAKVLNIDELNNELLIKMLDGWQFSAILQKPLEFTPQGLVRFQVQGFEDGKLIIKMINHLEVEDKTHNSIENTLREQNISSNKSDIDLLKSMVKHGMPLTKENISEVKNIMDFKAKIISEPEEENKFINKYLNSKNIDVTSKEATQVREVLKGFFNELKSLSSDEFLAMKENSIELTEENIKSFKEVFKENNDTSIYSKLNDIVNKSSKDSSKTEMIFEPKEINKFINKYLDNENIDATSKEVKDFLSLEEVKVAVKDIFNLKGKIEFEPKEENKLIDNYLNSKNVDSTSKEGKQIREVLKEVFSELKSLSSDEVKGMKENTFNLKENLVQKNGNSEVVKDQMNTKTEKMKENIKVILDKFEGKLSLDSESSKNIANMLNENINDFKVFNSVSNQYYYLDIPLNKDDSEYQCKLIIKDDRKDGKIIDSKNIKMVISVSTTNLGIVDAYINVKEEKMNIEMKCDEIWIPLLDRNSDNIIKKLSNSKYNIFVNVEEKKEEVSLTNCKEFFEDNGASGINVVV